MQLSSALYSREYYAWIGPFEYFQQKKKLYLSIFTGSVPFNFVPLLQNYEINYINNHMKNMYDNDDILNRMNLSKWIFDKCDSTQKK